MATPKTTTRPKPVSISSAEIKLPGMVLTDMSTHE